MPPPSPRAPPPCSTRGATAMWLHLLPHGAHRAPGHCHHVRRPGIPFHGKTQTNPLVPSPSFSGVSAPPARPHSRETSAQPLPPNHTYSPASGPHSRPPAPSPQAAAPVLQWCLLCPAGALHLPLPASMSTPCCGNNQVGWGGGRGRQGETPATSRAATHPAPGSPCLPWAAQCPFCPRAASLQVSHGPRSPRLQSGLFAVHLLELKTVLLDVPKGGHGPVPSWKLPASLAKGGYSGHF